jgi:hypothetical protein
MTRISPIWRKPVVLAGLTMLFWSALFATTYGYSFFWDDLHFIRTYSWAEILSTFHGPNDPDGIETPALRPIATLLFCFQGTIFGENVVLQRVFMAGLMGGLLWTFGLLLKEVGLSFRYAAVVFVLFSSSRVFASLMLWITLGSLILCYIFMTLTAVFYLRWLTGERPRCLALTLGFAALAVFTREEAYTLPVVLLLLWCITSPSRTNWRRTVAGVFGVASIMAAHFILRRVFVPGTLPIELSLKSARSLLRCLRSAWMPCGDDVRDDGDLLLKTLWQSFLVILILAFVRIGSNRSLVQFFGFYALGVILCTSALGAPRPYGIGMPTLAFFTAISIVILEVYQRSSRMCYGQPLWRPAVLSVLLLGIAMGVWGGIQRSMYVAEALHENSVLKVIRDGRLLFDLDEKPASIPAGRRKACMARLAALGIQSPADWGRLVSAVKKSPRPFILNRDTRSALFLAKYDYMSY